MLRSSLEGGSPAVLCYPMHGQSKLATEGYRTRDGHIIEWLGRLETPGRGVAVLSRPEPVYLDSKYPIEKIAENTFPIDSISFKLPNPLNRRDWWYRSVRALPALEGALHDVPAVIWNPFVSLAPAVSNPYHAGSTTILDLLDDWSIHYAFQGLKKHVERAYQESFALATYVIANSEGTMDLARRYGRDDAVLVLNGVDPERFSTNSTAAGQLTVGYVGKIGKRLDLALIQATTLANPQVDFVFAGPILDEEYKKPLSEISNVKLLGDVSYSDVPGLLEEFDIGWIPHAVGAGEVGGDAIKLYEYRASGLPVLTTPINGIEDRGFAAVSVLEGKSHADWIRRQSESFTRPMRVAEEIPNEMTWRSKAMYVRQLYSASD